MSDDLSCDLCGDQGPLLLQAKCHMTAPLRVVLDGDTLILFCYVPECNREVARFKVERGLPTALYEAMRAQIIALAERVEAQSELLGKAAEK